MKSLLLYGALSAITSLFGIVRGGAVFAHYLVYYPLILFLKTNY